MQRVLSLLLVLGILSCRSQDSCQVLDYTMEHWYEQHKGNEEPSIAHGTTGEGTLDNGKLVPWSGSNFRYFDEWSYLNERAYVHDKVKATLINSYTELDTLQPHIQWRIMECSKKEGGKISGHRTHQNGLSIDFMMPKKKDGEPFTDWDDWGTRHYPLQTDNNGCYLNDTTVRIDFELVAEHILLLDKHARQHKMHVKKVIIMIELKDDLFEGTKGQQLQKSGIYVVKGLRPNVNKAHGDHYHIDFGEL